jgi:ABC-type sugar transport system substrate-binding protein
MIILAFVGCMFFGGIVHNAQAAEKEEQIVIGISVMNQANAFWTSWLEPIYEFAEENNIKLMINDGQDKPEKQVEALENWTMMGVDGIVVCPIDVAATSVVTDQAYEKGIKVFASFYKLNNYHCYNYASQYEMGYLLGHAAAEWIKENLGDQKKVQVAITHMDTVPAVVDRKLGTIDGVSEAPNVEIVGTAWSSNAETGIEVAENFLQAYPDLQVFLGSNDGAALGGLEAFKAAGKTGDQYLLGGVDAIDQAMLEIWDKDTPFRMSVLQDPRAFGKNTIETMYKAIIGEPYEKETQVSVHAITEENIHEYVDADGNLIK